MMFVLNQFVRLVIFLSITPIHLPKRMDRIRNIFSDDHDSGLIYIDINPYDRETEFNINKLSLQELKDIVKVLQDKVNRGEFRITREENTRYLLTKIRRCCGRAVKARWTDGTSATLFTSTGVVSAISFTFTCQVCQKRYFPSYSEEKDSAGVVHRTYAKLSGEDVRSPSAAFHVTKETFFSYDFMRCLTYDIVITHCEFSNYCAAYNAKYSDDTNKDLIVRRLIDAYLIYHLAKRIDLSFTVPRDDWRGIDTEAICNLNYPHLKESIDFRWLSHTCNSPGCLRRVVVGDGDQKLFRTRCEAVGDQIILERGEVSPIRACPENPLPGKTFCSAHLDGQAAKSPVEQSDIRRVTRQSFRQLGIEIEELTTSSDNSGEGCRLKENITTNANNRQVTCGMLYFFRDCFLRLGHVEMLTAESCTIIVQALIDLFGMYPASTLIMGLAFDRACELAPFMKNKGVSGNLVMKYWSLISMVVDKFHIGGHKRPECTLTHELCKYHPDQLSNKDLWGDVNTECAEQSFRVLNKSKHTTRYMSRARRMVYFKILDDEFNMILEEKLRKSGNLIVAGSDISYEESRRNSVDKTLPPNDFLRLYGGQLGTNLDQQEGMLERDSQDAEFYGGQSGTNLDQEEAMIQTDSQDEEFTEAMIQTDSQDEEFTSQESGSSNMTCDLCGATAESTLTFSEHLQSHFNI